MFDYLNNAILFSRRVFDEKSTLESVIAENIEATRSLVVIIMQYDAMVTRLWEKQQQCQDDEQFKRRASDRR